MKSYNEGSDYFWSPHFSVEINLTKVRTPEKVKTMAKKIKYSKIRDIPKVDRPREKLAKSGVAALKDEELLAIIFRTGYKGKNVIEVARDVLKQYPKKSLVNADFEKLSKIPGVGPTRAAQLLAGFALAKRMIIKKEGERIIQTPEDVYEYVPEIRNAKKEKFVAIYLNTRNAVITRETISIGSLNANIVHPREVFHPAVKSSAASVILVHNHPSGDTSPSNDDIETTKRIVEAGKIMGIEVLDHVIVTNKNYKSMKEEGLI